MKHTYRCCKDGQHRHNWRPKNKVSRRNRAGHTPGPKPNHTERAINIHNVFPPIGAAPITTQARLNTAPVKAARLTDSQAHAMEIIARQPLHPGTSTSETGRTIHHATAKSLEKLGLIKRDNMDRWIKA